MLGADPGGKAVAEEQRLDFVAQLRRPGEPQRRQQADADRLAVAQAAVGLDRLERVADRVPEDEGGADPFVALVGGDDFALVAGTAEDDVGEVGALERFDRAHQLPERSAGEQAGLDHLDETGGELLAGQRRQGRGIGEDRGRIYRLAPPGFRPRPAPRLSKATTAELVALLSHANAWHRESSASFGEKSGWERVNWYEPNAAEGDEALRPRGWAGQNWSPAIGAEHRACRERVAIFDESSFAKLEIEGPGAASFLEGLCDNRVARGVGQITYTQMLNRRGGIECDFTVARLGEERFGIVTGTAFGNHDREWMRRHLPADGGVWIHDVT